MSVFDRLSHRSFFLMLTPQQTAEIRKDNLDFLFDLSNRTAEGAEKLAALNMQAIRITLADTFELAQKALSVNEPQEWLALQDTVAAPMADRVQRYSRQVIDIMSATQTEFARIGKSQCDSYGQQVRTITEEITRNGPAGSEATVTALNSALAAANALYDALQSSGRKAVEATRTNLDVAVATSKSATRAIVPVSQSGKG
jgi:phasin family protein